MSEIGKLFVVPIMNLMGPVTDSRFDDLLNTWDQVDQNLKKMFETKYRNQIVDSYGNSIILNWFFVSLSGFKTNPVKRDFGWYNIYDHYKSNFGESIEKFGDGIYWMYNHPPASGVGNEWGVSWFDNSHYFEILNRYIIEKNYFPSVVELLPETNDASNWVDNWFPFDFSNRNVSELKLEASQEGNVKVSDGFDWRGAPDNWTTYTPSREDHRKKGSLNRHIFRVLDIKTRIYQITESEIEKGFIECMNGNNVVISAYEHDFRDRSKIIIDDFIKPISKIAKKYPQVKWSYANALNSAKQTLCYEDETKPQFTLKQMIDSVSGEKIIRIFSSKKLFGKMPYFCTKNLKSLEYKYYPLENIGNLCWQIPQKNLPKECIIGIASSDKFGNVGLQKFNITNEILTSIN